MNDTDRLLELIGAKSKVSSRIGTYVGSADGQALIDIDRSRFPVTFLTAYIPPINEPVHVWSVDGQWFLLGPTSGKPRVGTVLTVSSPRATVSTSMGNVSAIIGGTAPTSGDRVLLDWTEDGPVTGLRLATTPAAPTPPVDPGGGGSTVKEAIFREIDAGSTDRGSARWWQAQPWASDSTLGAWFYGSQIRDTIPSSAQLVSMEMYINRVQDSGASPRFTLHTDGWKGGIPGMSAPVTWDPPNGWNAVPSSGWFGSLIAGGPYWGIGLNQGGFNKFAALTQDGLSGALRIKWR